jgi:hypothetical protein
MQANTYSRNSYRMVKSWGFDATGRHRLIFLVRVRISKTPQLFTKHKSNEN